MESLKNDYLEQQKKIEKLKLIEFNASKKFYKHNRMLSNNEKYSKQTRLNPIKYDLNSSL